ncbi:MAG: hypothetical protein J7556_22705 [Acidovorax sp.]|nr:hypothetical protein [Acidovorax sp.]
MKPFKFRASSLGRIMTDALSIDPALLTGELAAIARKKSKTDEDKALLAPLRERTLSAGAKTFLDQLAKEFVYGFEQAVSSKYLDKGTQVEGDSIDLYNAVFFTSLTKNTERRENEWITGECDIVTPARIIDIKSAWSLASFPATAAQAHDADYEWQMRAYMWLWDRPEAEVAYCLVDTPPDLIGHEDETLHCVSHINPALRVTPVRYQRDHRLEQRIQAKVQAANAYIEAAIRQIADEHPL